MITIDGKQYDENMLSDEAKAQIISLQFVDSKIRDLQAQLAVYQTARQAYAESLKALLPSPEEDK